ncbi:MAG TPA: diguanylate cyclase [Solirubrobacteraceae bacterium]
MSGLVELPPRARGFILAVIAAGAAMPALVSLLAGAPRLDLGLLALAAAACAAGNLFEVFAPGHYALQPNFAVFFASVVLLPPWASALVAVAAFVPGWLAGRSPWFKAAFNMANYALAGTAASGVLRLHDAVAAVAAAGLQDVAVLVAAAAVFAMVNHLLIATVASFASGVPVRRNLHQIADGLPLDVALGVTGASLAVLWHESPALVALAAGPLALVYRALALPQLEHKARTDAKTGLFNSEHFRERLEEEVDRARRTGGTVAVVMVDLDHLREVNNRCGHLAGDRVIRGVADALVAVNVDTGVAARFGGEEYCLLLPGGTVDDARAVAEELRARVSETRFRADDDESAAETLRVTLSAGVAAFPEHGDSAQALIKAADVAVYEAKAAGRNRVRVALAPEARAALDLRPAGAALAAPAPADAPVLRLAEVTPERSVAPGERAGDDTSAAPAGPPPAVGTRRLVPPYAATLAIAGALLGAWSAGQSAPVLGPLLGLLIAAVVALDVSDLDVFGRGRLSPGAVPSVALACAFGPVGPVLAEAVVTLLRVVRGEAGVRSAFNFGALSLSGGAAAAVFALMKPGHGVGLVLVAILAALVYYAVNATLVAGVWALDEALPPTTAWRARFAWAMPHYLAFGAASGLLLLAYDDMGTLAFAVFGFPLSTFWLAQRQYLARARESLESLGRRNDELSATNERLRTVVADNQDLVRSIHESYLATITALARSIEAKDPYTGDHTERVAAIATRIAAQLDFGESDRRAIAVGAVIHDIGKIGVPDAILLKPGRLTDEEFAVMRRHPEISSYILAELELPPLVKNMVRNHHERYDGMGYPDRLSGERIPLAARVLSVADALDAMTSDRPYRPAMSFDDALEEVRQQAGRQFCPTVLRALDESLAAQPAAWSALRGAGDGERRAA